MNKSIQAKAATKTRRAQRKAWVKNFIRPRHLVLVTFADFTPWTEVYGPFRTKAGEERFIRTIERKGYHTLVIAHETISSTRAIKRVPDLIVGDPDDAEPPFRLDPRIPNQRSA